MPPDPLESVLDVMDSGLIVYDALGSPRAVNRAACELLGLSSREVRDRTDHDARWEVVDASGMPLRHDALPMVVARLRHAPVRGVELGVYHPDRGDWGWLEVSAVPRLTSTGELDSVVVTLIDVTGRRRLAEAVRLERHLRDEVLRAVPAGILVLDGQDHVRLASDEARRLLDLSPDRTGPFDLHGSLVGADGTQTARDDSPAQRVRASARPLAGARYIWTSRSGRRRVLLVTGARLENPQWRNGVVLAFHDVTQWQASERAIRHSERRLSAALRAADLGRVDLDFRQRTVSADPNWLARHGFSRTLAEGDFDLWNQRFCPEGRTAVAAALAGHKRSPTDTLETELWLRKDDGGACRVRIIGQVEGHDGAGRVLAVSGVLMDITAEYTAQVAASHLEANAAEMARLEGVAAVAGGVAHTLSNLLVGVQGTLQSARETVPDDSELAASLDLLAEAGTRAAEVSTQLRAVSGRSRFAVKRARLDALVAQAHAMLQVGLRDRAELVVRVEGTLPEAEADIDQLRLVLMNLVLNAADASAGPDHVVTLRVRAVEVQPDDPLEGLVTPTRPPPGTYVVVEVIDQGHGMAPDVRARMFEPFFTTRDDHRGLGLSAVLGVARGHGGYVRVCSSEGSGTAVTIGLPALVPPELPVRPPPPTVRSSAPAPVAAAVSSASVGAVPDTAGPTADGGEPAAAAPPAGPHRAVSSRPPRSGSSGGGQILVVDDESIIRRLVTRVLERSGYSVEAAAGGHAALDLLEADADRYCVMLLDLTMPELSGHDVLRMVMDRWPELPVVVMSGYVDDDEVGRLLVRGGIRFLPKPFGAADLREIVAGAVRGDRPTLGPG